MVGTAVFAGPLDGQNVHGLLDDADHRRVAAGIRADGAGLGLGDVAANAAVLDLRPELQDRLREPLGVSLGGTEQVEGDPLGRFPAQSRKAGQLRDDRFQQGARILHGA